MGIRAIPIHGDSQSFPFPIVSSIPFPLDSQWEWESHSHDHLYRELYRRVRGVYIRCVNLELVERSEDVSDMRNFRSFNVQDRSESVGRNLFETRKVCITELQ